MQFTLLSPHKDASARRAPRGRVFFSLLLLGALTPKNFPRAQMPVTPRMAQAVELAGRQRRDAQARHALALAVSTTTAAAVAVEVARAKAWEQALQKAATAATPSDSDAVVTAIHGAGRLERAGQAPALAPGMLLREGDGVSILEGEAEVRFHDGSSLTLGRGSELRVLQPPRSMPQQSVFALNRGALHWEAWPGAQGVTRVLAPKSSAVLRTGRCELRVDPDGVASLRVYSGSAELSSRPDVPPAVSDGWWQDPFR